MPKVDTQSPARPGEAASRPAEYHYVELTHAVEAAGAVFPAGTRGVVVHRHADEIGYEVEFEKPRFAVLTLTSRDIEAV